MSSLLPLRVWIPGDAQPQPRPRARVLHRPNKGAKKCSECGWLPGHSAVQMVSSPAKAPITGWRSSVAQALRRAVAGRVIMPVSRPYIWGGEEGLQVKLDFLLPRPTGHWSSRTGKLRGAASKRQHLVKPDLDNLAKPVLDEMQGTVFERDQQVVCLRVTKRYANPGEEPGVHVMARPFRVQTDPA